MPMFTTFTFEVFAPHIEHGGLWLEFGVAGGGTIRKIAAMTNDNVYGFDWWQGLPDGGEPGYDGSWGWHKGDFACPAPTGLPGNVFLVRGLFQQTLPVFMEDHPRRLSFVHIDCDLYSSTKFVMETLKLRGLDGTVIVFDEIRGFSKHEANEGRAWSEFLADGDYSAEMIGEHHVEGAGYKLRALK